MSLETTAFGSVGNGVERTRTAAFSPAFVAVSLTCLPSAPPRGLFSHTATSSFSTSLLGPWASTGTMRPSISAPKWKPSGISVEADFTDQASKWARSCSSSRGGVPKAARKSFQRCSREFVGGRGGGAMGPDGGPKSGLIHRPARTQAS